MNTIAYFEIQAANPEKAISFYQKVFGWNFVKDTSIPIVLYLENVGRDISSTLIIIPLGYFK